MTNRDKPTSTLIKKDAGILDQSHTFKHKDGSTGITIDDPPDPRPSPLPARHGVRPLETITMVDLLDTHFPLRQPIIDGFLYPGTCLIAGPPKVGKSLLMCQIGFHVSIGESLWGYPVRQGAVLYLALEDNKTRLHSRLTKMYRGESTPNLHFAIRSKPLRSGLIEQLNDFISTHPDLCLIIIDTLQKIRTLDPDAPAYSYSHDYDIINTLKILSDDHNICILVVHHTRKQRSADTFDMISGTNGLFGCADGALMMTRGRSEMYATIEITGRDQPASKVHLIRDADTLGWHLDYANSDCNKDETPSLIKTIAAFITAENSTWSGSATELASLLGVDMSPNIVSRTLNAYASPLRYAHNIVYNTKRTHNGSLITLEFQSQNNQ